VASTVGHICIRRTQKEIFDQVDVEEATGKSTFGFISRLGRALLLLHTKRTVSL